MNDLIAVLRSWVYERGAACQFRPWMVFKEPSGSFPKAAAVVEWKSRKSWAR